MKPCILELAIYGYVDGYVLLSFSCTGFALIFFIGVSFSLFQREPFLRSASLGQGVVPNSSSVFASNKCILFSLPLKTL
jgi:hypothetical protein